MEFFNKVIQDVRMSSWYVVRCKSKKENVVVRSLENLNISVYCPKIYAGSEKNKKPRLEAMFPGYVFISKESSSDSLQKVKYAVGVIEIVAFSDFPAEVGGRVVDEITAIEKILMEKSIRPDSRYLEGDNISIEIGGARIGASFVRYEGVDRAVVLLNILSATHFSNIGIKDINFRKSA